MKRIFKFCAIFLGTFFTSGLVSCSDDDDNSCCSSTYVYDGLTYSYTYCPDGTYSYSIDGQEIASGTWTDWATWEEIQEAYCN